MHHPPESTHAHRHYGITLCIACPFHMLQLLRYLLNLPEGQIYCLRMHLTKRTNTVLVSKRMEVNGCSIIKVDVSNVKRKGETQEGDLCMLTEVLQVML